MISKASENLECAKMLGENLTYFDAAANRAYYAAYHASWYYLAKIGRSVPDVRGKKYWPHDRILEVLQDMESVEFDNDFDVLQHHRIKADYSPDNVKQSKVAEALVYAEQIVEWVMNNV
ncbi:MAG: HEPN domain-containing protein [Phycisphaerae bacterium]|nr:HEPN domain-containing protein [Phycisphaerae bacterium]